MIKIIIVKLEESVIKWLIKLSAAKRMSLTMHWMQLQLQHECCVCVLQFYWAVNIEWNHIKKTGTHKAERVNTTTITEIVQIGYKHRECLDFSDAIELVDKIVEKRLDIGNWKIKEYHQIECAV